MLGAVWSDMSEGAVLDDIDGIALVRMVGSIGNPLASIMNCMLVLSAESWRLSRL